MTQEKNNHGEVTADREIVITRVVDAPRELVWEAMTNPVHVVQWWGPRGFSTTIETMDFRPGGIWKHVMHGPDGTDYPNKSIFKEIIKPERIVYSHGGGKKGTPGVSFVATWSFDVVDTGKTRVTIRQVFASAEERDTVAKVYGAIEGGKQTLDRLSEHLPKMASVASREFVISRVFDAPRELVWKAWTESRHMTQWWGPKVMTNPVCDMDVRPGGAYRIVMRAPDGAEYPIKGVFREVVKPERLVMTMDCSGHPAEWHNQVNPDRDKAETHPSLEILTTITLEEENGKTRLTVRQLLESKAIRDAMVKMGMTEGWSQSLDRLTALLQQMP